MIFLQLRFFRSPAADLRLRRIQQGCPPKRILIAYTIPLQLPTVQEVAQVFPRARPVAATPRKIVPGALEPSPQTMTRKSRLTKSKFYPATLQQTRLPLWVK